MTLLLLLIQLLGLFIMATSALAVGWFRARIDIMHQRPTEPTPENLAILEWLIKAIEETRTPWFAKPFYWLRLGRLRKPRTGLNTPK